MKNTNFTVNVRLKAIVSFSINAASLEDAVTKAREEIQDRKFIADGLEYIDGKEELIGVDADWGLE